MAHAEWCGKPCCECTNPCRLDESIPCSPDCPLLGEDGDPIDYSKCKDAGCDAYEDEDEDEEEDEEDGIMLEVCVPESKIENVSVEYGKYYVLYFSGKQIVYTNPPKSVTDFIAKTPTKEHLVCEYGDRKYEWDLYRNYRTKEE